MCGDPIRVNEVLVGLEGVNLVGVEDSPGRAVESACNQKAAQGCCVKVVVVKFGFMVLGRWNWLMWLCLGGLCGWCG